MKREVLPITIGAAHGFSRKLVREAPLRKLVGVRAKEREVEKSFAQQMASAAVQDLPRTVFA